MRQIINAEDAPATQGGYSQAVKLDSPREWLLVSGQIPVSADGVVPEGFAEQARLCWSNIDAQLRAAGMARTDLQKITIFLSDRSYADANRKARTAYLGDHACALTVIIAGIFDPHWLLEIDAVAAR